MVDISIIMPIYNGEKYLDNTIKSIMNQSFWNFELILWDDGSTDNSFSICRKWADSDRRIRLYRSENEGISASRNKAIKKSLGKYIAFIDQDDEVDGELYTVLWKLAIENDADVSRVGYKISNIDAEGMLLKEIVSLSEDCVWNYNDVKDNFSKFRDIFQSVWNCIYRRSVIVDENIIFDENMRYGGEDIAFNIEFVVKSKVIVTSSYVGYHHYKRISTSTSANLNDNRILSILMINEKEIGIIDELYFDEREKIQWQTSETLANICLLLTIICEHNEISDRRKISMLRELKKEKTLNISVVGLINRYIFNYYKKRLLAGVLFKLRMYRILVFLGHYRVR